jgi:TetR/AcrR family transcriptional repressor of nem operon
MGRPREFEEEEVVSDALRAFWERGYGATSISDLIQATEVERGSLYKAFRDKHSLFERAFDSYLRAGRAAMTQTLQSADPPLLKLQNWLKQVTAGCSGSEGGPGCLAVNSMVELAPSDSRIRERLARHWALVERALESTFKEGQQAGAMRDDLSAKELARTVVRIMAGIAVFARQGVTLDVSRTIVQLVRKPG